MELYQLRYLKEIYTCKSYTKAAANLQHTPSALTIAIQKLESELGVRLFIRKGRAIEPTGACLHLIPFIEQTISDTDKLINAIPKTPSDVSTVSFGIPDLVFFNSVINMKSYFASKGITVNILQSNHQRQLEDNLGSGALDLAVLRVFGDQKKNYKFESWRDENYWAYVPSSSPYADMERITPDVLSASQIVLSREMSDIKSVVAEYLRGFSYTPKQLCNDAVSLHSAYRLTNRQNGICIAPRIMPNAVGMKLLPIYPPLRTELIIAFSPAGVMSPVQRAIGDYILESPADETLPRRDEK